MIAATQPGYFTLDSVKETGKQFYEDNGFLIVENAVSDAELTELAAETTSICRGQRGTLSRAPGTESSKLTDEMLAQMPEEELIQHFLCIHQAHKISDVMHRYLGHPAIVDVLTRIVSPNVKCMQSMLFIKAAGKPGQAWHQDEDYIPTRDRSLVGAWIAIDDATVENGCLWVIPGSHGRGILWPQYAHKDQRFDCNLMAYNFPYDETRDAIPVEVSRGSIVFFNGYLLHRSLPNHAASGFRRVLVNHYMSAESVLPWRVQEGMGVAKMDYRDIVMIAGEDPYAWKGVDDLSGSGVRSAGRGGCGDGRVELEEHLQKPLAELRRS